MNYIKCPKCGREEPAFDYAHVCGPLKFKPRTNERIRELADEAAKYSAVMALPTGQSGNELFVEKFAELIVKECVTRLEQHHPFTKDPEAYLYAISLIEEHFGVE